MQAIRTKYMPPTNHRGPQIKAYCQAKNITLSWDDSLNADMNHLSAAKTLATQLGWNYGTWVEGELPDGSSVFVCHDTSGISDTFVVNGGDK